MARWKITRRAPGSDAPRQETGEVYDDQAGTGSIDEYVEAIALRDGWDYGAEPA